MKTPMWNNTIHTWLFLSFLNTPPFSSLSSAETPHRLSPNFRPPSLRNLHSLLHLIVLNPSMTILTQVRSNFSQCLVTSLVLLGYYLNHYLTSYVSVLMLSFWRIGHMSVVSWNTQCLINISLSNDNNLEFYFLGLTLITMNFKEWTSVFCWMGILWYQILLE